MLLILLLFNLAFGGVVSYIGKVELKPFERKKVCGICIYSTLPKKGRFSVEYSDNLKKFVEAIYPNDFELEPINCPKEPKARRKCIDRECANPNSTSAKIVCTYFKGPFELSLFPKKVEYRGGVKSVEKVGAAVLVLPMDFVVVYTPFNAWIILIPSLLLIAWFVKKRFRKK